MNDPSASEPILAITLGDPAGVGPEIILKAFQDRAFRQGFVPVVVGSRAILEMAEERLHLKVPLLSLDHPRQAPQYPESLPVLDLDNIAPERLPIGKVSAKCGKAAVEYVEKATHLALEGALDAIVTAPLNKEALRLSGCPYPGHTEILAYLTGSPCVSMMLLSGSLRVIHVTAHLSLRQAIERLSQERILEAIRTAHTGIRQLGIPNPRIAVAGLNPHAGEEGLFGREDLDSIAPAVALAQKEGFQASGPYPPDTIFYRASQGEFDGVVAMYHDQGHIAVKMHGFDKGVNVTLGLPIIRTSVDHGTAFDIAWQGKASEASLKEAIRIALQMVKAK